MKTETLQFKRLVRMVAVGEEVRDRLPEVAGKLLDAIRTGVGGVNDLTATLYTGRARIRELAQLKKVVRSALRRELRTIWRTARAVALNHPDLDPSKFRVPVNNDQKLLAVARSALANLQPLVADFAAHAMPPKFLDRLKSRLEEFERTLAEYAASKRIVEDLKRQIAGTMREAVRGGMRLDAAVHNTLGHEGATIAAWEAACLLRRPRRTRRSVESEALAERSGREETESSEESAGGISEGLPDGSKAQGASETAEVSGAPRAHSLQEVSEASGSTEVSETQEERSSEGRKDSGSSGSSEPEGD